MADNKIELVQGDITKMLVDAIINAANTSLLGGGGCEWRHPSRRRQSHTGGVHQNKKQTRRRQVGKAVIITAGNTPSKYVIHTAGPLWSQTKKGADQLLANAYGNSLKLAVENKAKTIAFPDISTGVNHFPKDNAAEIAIRTVKDFCQHISK